tara:strand:- start:96 stop:287 length:192 start_codon:yes stop_codon:yes gene_type:complete
VKDNKEMTQLLSVRLLLVVDLVNMLAIIQRHRLVVRVVVDVLVPPEGRGEMRVNRHNHYRMEH